MDKAPAVSSREDDIIGKVAEEAGGLGIEIADVAGTVDDLTAHAQQQSESFQQLRDVSDTMAQSNERVSTAAENATRSAENATTRVQASAETLETSLADIASLVDAVTTIEGELGGLRDALEKVGEVAESIKASTLR